MKLFYRQTLAFSFLALCLLSNSSSGFGYSLVTAPDKKNETPYVPGQIIVQFNDQLSACPHDILLQKKSFENLPMVCLCIFRFQRTS